jgi:hypothetical protein
MQVHEWSYSSKFRVPICFHTVRLDDAWWNDPHAKTLPSVHASFKDVHKNQPEGWVTSVNASFPGPTRKDGFVPVISYKLQPQVSLTSIYKSSSLRDISGVGKRARQ